MGQRFKSIVYYQYKQVFARFFRLDGVLENNYACLNNIDEIKI